MIYGLDVSTATAAPVFKWRFGCTNISVANTASCTPGANQMGQTWSAPVVARIKGYSTGTAPVVIVGGGITGVSIARETAGRGLRLTTPAATSRSNTRSVEVDLFIV